MTRYLQIYWLMVQNSIIREMNFKANFILWMVVELLWFLGQLVFIEVLFGYVDALGDWSKWQVVALVGTHQLVSQIFQSFFYVNLANLPELIRTGKLDLLLLLPVDAQFAVSCKQYGLDNLVNALVGVGIVTFSLMQLHLTPTLGQVALFSMAVICGVAVHYSLFLALATMSFWIVRAQGLIYGYYNLMNIGRYPDVVFKGLFRVVFMYVVPIILIANVPVRIITQHTEAPWQALGTLAAMAAAVVLATRLFWRTALKRYSSASS